MKIAIYHMAPVPYSPDRVKDHAIGGTEISAVNLWKSLNDSGHDCHFFGEVDQKSQGWHDLSSYDPLFGWDALIAIECYPPEIFLKDQPNYIWLHNISPSYDGLIPATQNTPNLKYIVLSEWHKQDMLSRFGIPDREMLTEDKMVIIGDPCNSKEIRDNHTKGGLKSMLAINISRPERSAKYLAPIFKKIRAAEPSAELHMMAYDLGNYNPDDPLGLRNSLDYVSENTDQIYADLKAADVQILRSRPHHELWDYMADFKLMLCPMAEFNETFGMTHVEALALGMDVIASETGATPEILKGVGTIIPGDPADPDVQQLWADAALKKLRAKSRVFKAKYTRAMRYDQAEIAQLYVNQIAKDSMSIEKFEGSEPLRKKIWGKDAEADPSQIFAGDDEEWDYLFWVNSTLISPDSIETEPLGGSETALIYHARILAEKGFRVAICGNVNSGGYADVRFIRVEVAGDLNRYKSKHFICSRLPQMTVYTNCKFKHLKLSDDIDQEHMDPLGSQESNDYFDTFIVVSEYHKQQILKMGVPVEKIIVSTDGVDLTTIPKVLPGGKAKRAIYASTPFRGLDKLIDMAPRVFSETGVEIHIYSDLGVYKGDDTPFKELYERAKNTKGMVYHGTVPREELMQILSESMFMIYPSTFAETCCMIALEAQGAGCVPITTALGALPEKIQSGRTGYVVRSFDRTDAEIATEMIARINQIQNDPDMFNSFSWAGRRWIEENYQWADVVTSLLAAIDEKTIIERNMLQAKFRIRKGDISTADYALFHDFYSNIDKYYPVDHVDDYQDMSTVGIRFQEILKHMPADRSVSVLDAGCWTGGMLKGLYDNGYENLTGLDLSQAALEVADLGFDWGEWIHGDVQQINTVLDGRLFDVIHAGEVLEHVLEPAKLMESLKAHLNPNGVMIVSTPHRFGGFGIVNDDDPQHINPGFTEEEIMAMGSVDGAAYRVEHFLYYVYTNRVKADLLPGISVCILARNEAKNIAKAIKSVIGIADEIVVLDDNSSDDTVKIAKADGATIYSRGNYPFRFDHAKNEMTGLAKHEWIFELDADEVLTPGSQETVLEAIKHPDVHGYTIMQKNLSDNLGDFATTDSRPLDPEDLPLASGHPFHCPTPTVRLYRNDPRIKHTLPVHELVIYSMQDAGLNVDESLQDLISVLNLGDTGSSPEKEEHRRKLYLELGKLKAEENPNGHNYYELAVECKENGDWQGCHDAIVIAIEKDPLDSKYHQILGAALGALEKQYEAMESYRVSIDLDPKNKYSLNNLGCIYMNSNRALAKSFFERALAADPTWELAKENVALFD